MAFLPATVSRRVSWRLMILGACIGVVVGPILMGWRTYPWISLPFVLAGIIILHPVMDKDLPSLIGVDMLRSPRTYIAVVLFAVAQIAGTPNQKAFLERFLNAH